GIYHGSEHVASPRRGFKPDQTRAHADGEGRQRDPTEPGQGAVIHRKSRRETKAQQEREEKRRDYQLRSFHCLIYFDISSSRLNEAFKLFSSPCCAWHTMHPTPASLSLAACPT